MTSLGVNLDHIANVRHTLYRPVIPAHVSPTQGLF